MARVEVAKGIGGNFDTPSEEIVKKAAKLIKITDSLGRAIVLQKPGLLSQYKAIELAGPELAQNMVWLNMIQPLFWIKSIDGDPVHPPNSKLEVEVLIQRLDEEGMNAVMEAVIDSVSAKTEDQFKEQVGNSSGTPSSDKPSDS